VVAHQGGRRELHRCLPRRSAGRRANRKSFSQHGRIDLMLGLGRPVGR